MIVRLHDSRLAVIADSRGKAADIMNAYLEGLSKRPLERNEGFVGHYFRKAVLTNAEDFRNDEVLKAYLDNRLFTVKKVEESGDE